MVRKESNDDIIEEDEFNEIKLTLCHRLALSEGQKENKPIGWSLKK